MSKAASPEPNAVPVGALSEDGGWKFAQCFGDKEDVEEVTDADVISSVEFDRSGDFLATGDRGGRVVLFERNKAKKLCEYKFYTEFQSHEPEFDYLKSVEIEEKINKIRWCKRQGNFHLLLSTNDKTIKLWKIYEKTVKKVAEGFPAPTTTQTLRLPKMVVSEAYTAAQPKRIYANAHTYHINSISINSDGETFLSADDLRVNLWNFGVSDQSFNIVDIKPANMEELQEVITAAEFHPSHCNMFIYSSSKGSIKMNDMRVAALCDQSVKCTLNLDVCVDIHTPNSCMVAFEVEEDASNKSFFSEILASINDIKFSPDGRYILSRDYLTMKLWDVNMESKPVKTFNIHDFVRPKLVDLYDGEHLFDKFECNFSNDGKCVMSGSYSNYFHIYDRTSKSEYTMQADKSAFKKRANKGRNSFSRSAKKKEEINVETVDFNKKILHASWHPNEYSVAVAATNNLFLFSTL